MHIAATGAGYSLSNLLKAWLGGRCSGHGAAWHGHQQLHLYQGRLPARLRRGSKRSALHVRDAQLGSAAKNCARVRQRLFWTQELTGGQCSVEHLRSATCSSLSLVWEAAVGVEGALLCSLASEANTGRACTATNAG